MQKLFNGGLGAIGAGILGGTLTKRTVPAALLGVAGLGYGGYKLLKKKKKDQN